MHRWSIALVLVAVLGACTNDADPGPSTSTSEPTATSTTTLPTGTVEPCLSGDLPFESEGLVAAIGETEGDATRITQIRWERGSACERLIIDFAADSGAPATALGLTGVTVIPPAGIIRVDLPAEVQATAVADSLTDGLIARTFVVESDGELSVDVHGMPGTAIAARAFATGSPASLVIDVIPTDDQPEPIGAGVSETTVLVTPLPGPALYPFTIEAYAVPGAGSARVQLTSGAVEIIDLAIALAGTTDAWQAFSSTIEDGPSGEALLFVGQVDASESPVDGIEVRLDLP
jgi:hypothetical protein